MAALTELEMELLELATDPYVVVSDDDEGIQVEVVTPGTHASFHDNSECVCDGRALNKDGAYHMQEEVKIWEVVRANIDRMIAVLAVDNPDENTAIDMADAYDFKTLEAFKKLVDHYEYPDLSGHTPKGNAMPCLRSVCSILPRHLIKSCIRGSGWPKKWQPISSVKTAVLY